MGYPEQGMFEYLVYSNRRFVILDKTWINLNIVRQALAALYGAGGEVIVRAQSVECCARVVARREDANLQPSFLQQTARPSQSRRRSLEKSTPKTKANTKEVRKRRCGAEGGNRSWEIGFQKKPFRNLRRTWKRPVDDGRIYVAPFLRESQHLTTP